MQNRNYCNLPTHTIPTAQITFSVPVIPSLINFWPINPDGGWLKKLKKNKYTDVSKYIEQQGGGLPYFPENPLPLSHQLQQKLVVEQSKILAGPPPPPFNPAFVTDEQHASLTERAACLLSTGFIELIIGSN